MEGSTLSIKGIIDAIIKSWPCTTRLVISMQWVRVEAVAVTIPYFFIHGNLLEQQHEGFKSLFTYSVQNEMHSLKNTWLFETIREWGKNCKGGDNSIQSQYFFVLLFMHKQSFCNWIKYKYKIKKSSLFSGWCQTPSLSMVTDESPGYFSDGCYSLF